MSDDGVTVSNCWSRSLSYITRKLFLKEAFDEQKTRLEQRRRAMVTAVRRGGALRQVARQFRVSLYTVQYWVRRAGTTRLDRVNWSDAPRGPRQPAHKTPGATEDLVLAVRTHLRETSALGEYGDKAIARELRQRGLPRPPSVRTIGRILERRGLLDGHRRIRRPAPPPGWHLPDVAAGKAELDSCDCIEGLLLQGGPVLEVLTGLSLHGGLAGAWPRATMTAKTIVAALVEHWQAVGLPQYAQFDNDTRFQGPHQHPDVIGRGMRVCLSLGVVPVFVPPREFGFQAAIESCNGRWQAKVWARFHHASLPALQAQSAHYIAASRRRTAARTDAAPARAPVPAS